MTTLMVLVEAAVIVALCVSAFAFVIAPYTRWVAWFCGVVYVAYTTGSALDTAALAAGWAIILVTALAMNEHLKPKG